MNKLTLALALLSAALIGGTVATNLTVPSAQAGKSAQRWGYRCFHTSGLSDDVEEKANNRGNKGWEMVGSVLQDGSKDAQAIWCFKRALP